MVMPPNWASYIAEIPPKAKPLDNAYRGAVIGAHVFLNIVIKAKESLIAKVDLISDEDNDTCIKKFNDLKQQWKLAGSAGRKNDNKLWDKFNKSADRFFNAKKEDVEKDLEALKLLTEEIKNKTKSPSELRSAAALLVNLNKTKEMQVFIKNVSI